MSFSERVEAARLRAGTWWRERQERIAAKKAAKAYDVHGHSRFWLLNVPAIATILAAITEWYWALLFCIEATGAIDWNFQTAFGSDAPAAGAWNFAFEGHLPVLIGLLAATAPIVMLSMVWLPVQFAMRGSGRWRRGTIIAVGILANILVIVSGTVVMNYNRQDQVREALVVEQSADAQRQMLTASVDDLRAELDTLMNHRSTYVATAASVGAAAYERDYVTQARATNDPRLPLIERALGSARRADELRAQIQEARRAVATAAPAAAAQANVEDRVGVGLNTFAQYVEVYRPPFIALICTLIGIFGTWWVIAMLEHMNPRDVLRSGWADEGHRIEDKRGEAVVDSDGNIKMPEPMTPPRKRKRVYNPITGQEEVWVEPKGHYRPTGRKKKNPDGTMGELHEFVPDVPESERGVQTDGGARIAMSAAGPIELPAADASEQQAATSVQQATNGDANGGEDGIISQGAKPDAGDQAEPQGDIVQEEPPELSDEEALALADELAAEEQQQQPDETPAQPEPDEAVEQGDAEANPEAHRSEPETNPGRMIAAE